MGAGRSGNFALLRNGFCSSGFSSSETFLSNKHNYKELTGISIAHRNTLPPELRAKVDETRCIALSNRPGSYIALDHMEEKINLYMAETTRGKLRLENCENLVRQAALHKNVLLPAKERIEEALNRRGDPRRGQYPKLGQDRWYPVKRHNNWRGTEQWPAAAWDFSCPQSRAGGPA